jgi:hypothetical protein
VPGVFEDMERKLNMVFWVEFAGLVEEAAL